ncbi:hypothetical protein Dsin_031204 [Dipteronia sinensis]|uniref:Uncharacterized protein n=1 Tax=Dipteronia sinensis TaxID=43782 RepID=A0AAE0DRZ7_9ROSI|nr:hypothetical protein Dsin_031204 [Dipteronia sinensis]
MLQCLSIKSSSETSSIPASPATINNHACPPAGNSTEGSPATSTQRSPTVNLTWRYAQTVQTNSFKDMWTVIQKPNDDQNQVQVQIEHINGEEDPHQLHLSQVLQPNRECVKEALQHAKSNTLTRLVSDYFDHSESTTELCLLLHQSIYRARVLYAPLQELLEIPPLDNHSTQSRCNKAFEVLLQFDNVDNPFPCSNSHNFQRMRGSFSELKQELDRNLRKSRSRVRLFRRATSGTALCVIGTAAAVTIAAAVVATHALIAIVAAPFCTAYLPRDLTKKERAHAEQLDAAARGTFVLNNELETIDRLVTGLYTDIEGDKQLVKLALERVEDTYCINEVLKRLRKNQQKFTDQLKDLDEHICLCFNSVNKMRSLLLQKMDLHRTSNS